MADAVVTQTETVLVRNLAREKIKFHVCVFITPEVASVGLSEGDTRTQKIHYKKGIAPIAILGRANTSNQLDGFVKIISDSNRRVFGASLVAPTDGEMIHTLSLAIQLKINADILAEMIIAYPTFSEAIKNCLQFS